jgi:hypothetical protein
MAHVEAIIVTTLITTARVYKRETQAVLPSVCFEDCSKYIIPRCHCLHLARLADQCMSGTDQALNLAEDDGKVAALCVPDGHFSVALSNCEGCLSAHATDTRTANVAVLASLDQFWSYCNEIAHASLSSLQATVSIIQASLCSVNNITSDCPTASSRSVTVATISSKPAAVSTSVAASSAATNYRRVQKSVANHVIRPPGPPSLP